MHSFGPIAIAALAYCSAVTMANPMANPIGPGTAECRYPPYTVHIDSQDTEPGNPTQTAGYCFTKDCVNTRENSYTIGTSWSVGGDLGINILDIISAGVNTEFSHTEETGTAEGGQAPCDGPWYCALKIVPTVIRVKGTMQGRDAYCRNVGGVKPYEVQIPLKKDGQISREGVGACACPDFEHWADPGAPGVCPAPCGH